MSHETIVKIMIIVTIIMIKIKIKTIEITKKNSRIKDDEN